MSSTFSFVGRIQRSPCGALLWAAASLAAASLTGTARAESVSLVDEQVNVIDHPITGWLSVYNTSATYLVDGGQIGFSTSLYQSAWLEMSGGSIGYDLTAYTVSELYLFGGSVGDTLRAQTSASIDWSGGHVGGDVVAAESAVIRIYGSGFTVDFAPVPYGVLTATQGTLRGTLNDGSSIAVPFYHAGALHGAEIVTGTIELVSGEPVQSPPPDNSHLVVLLNDGAVHDVDDDRFDHHPLGVRVRSPASSTTLNVLPGAVIGHSIVVSDDGLLDISGGDIGFREHSCCSVLHLTDRATLRMSGGVVHGWSSLGQQAQAEISGGTLTDEIWLNGEALLEVTGGFLDGAVTTREDTRLEISGGYLADDVTVAGTALVRGGGLGEDLIVEFSGEVEIVGGDFRIWGQPVALGDVAEWSGRLTGVLENGDPLDVYFQRNQLVVSPTETLEGRLRLVPEPERLLLQLAGLAALMAMRSGRRGRSLR